MSGKQLGTIDGRYYLEFHRYAEGGVPEMDAMAKEILAMAIGKYSPPVPVIALKPAIYKASDCPWPEDDPLENPPQESEEAVMLRYLNSLEIDDLLGKVRDHIEHKVRRGPEQKEALYTLGELEKMLKQAPKWRPLAAGQKLLEAPQQ